MKLDWKKDFNIKIQDYQIYHSIGIINQCDGVSVLVNNNCKLDNVETRVIKNCN